ncbi:MAG: M56 family metallopeptidase, partial [Acidobacteriaceae bacterium]|nr:M56 family metallopeptidase [Acidobacteriaceae bacterium]
MIELLLKATFLLGTACIIAATLRHASAAARQLLWNITFACVLTLPVTKFTTVSYGWTPSPSVHRVLFGTVSAPDASDADAPQQSSPRKVPWKALYAAGFVLVLGRLLAGTARLARLTSRAAPYPRMQEAIPDACGRLDILVSKELTLPLTWGLWRPVILLPEASLTWQIERVRLVLAHEYAHIRRLDYLGQIAAHLSCALYWFHPLVW